MDENVIKVFDYSYQDCMKIAFHLVGQPEEEEEIKEE